MKKVTQLLYILSTNYSTSLFFMLVFLDMAHPVNKKPVKNSASITIPPCFCMLVFLNMAHPVNKKPDENSPSITVPPCFWILVFLNLQPSGNTDTSYLKMFECLKYCYILPENG